MRDERVAFDERLQRVGPGRVTLTASKMVPVPDDREQFADRVHDCERRDVL